VTSNHPSVRISAEAVLVEGLSRRDEEPEAFGAAE
jgi:hypothetical protein